MAERGSAGVIEGEGIVFRPLCRRLGFAGPASTLRLLAVLCLAAVFFGQSAPVFADEAAAPTVRVRAESAPPDGETADTSTDVSESQSGDGEQPLYRVDGREIDYPEPEPKPTAGDVIVGFSMAYVGYPYVAGGNTQAGFDCSGFTQFVVLNTLGIDIGHAVEGQPASGWWIDYGAWQPGDLVFFQNTYRAGISHVGIYIGDGLFVHAENEGTGVTISSMYSEYYGTRYWGSVRVG
jgi:cell wall-associated NlpC family hydrolase